MDDRTELSELIAPVKDRMFATVWRILRHAQDAEDALQNALTTVWRRQAQVKAHAAPQALVLRICADAAIDQFRRRSKVHTDIDQLEDPLSGHDSLPLDDLIREERLDIVMVAISNLSPKQSTAIVMKYVQEEPLEEIAQALDCSKETVREHLLRGRKRLRETLRNLKPGESQTEATSPISWENKDD